MTVWLCAEHKKEADNPTIPMVRSLDVDVDPSKKQHLSWIQSDWGEWKTGKQLMGEDSTLKGKLDDNTSYIKGPRGLCWHHHDATGDYAVLSSNVYEAYNVATRKWY